jgi:hypothetical protein
MLDAYFGRPREVPPVGIYTRYLPRGDAERIGRDLGLGIIDYYPVVGMLAPPWHILPGFLSEVKGAEFSVKTSWREGKPVETREYRTASGTVSQRVEKDAGGIGSEHISRHYIATPEDYRVMTSIVENTVLSSHEAAFKARKADLGGDGVVMARLDRSPYQKCLIELVGQEQFLLDLYDDPEPALELMNAIDRRLDESFDLALRSGAQILWQPDNVTVDMTPPAAFEEHLLPFYRKRARLAREAGKAYVVHMDGKVKPLRELIERSGIHVLESVSIAEMGGDLSPEEMGTLFDSVSVFPNFPSNWCLKGDAELEKLARDFVAQLAGRPCMLQFSEDIPMSEWKRVYPLVARVVSGYGSGGG